MFSYLSTHFFVHTILKFMSVQLSNLETINIVLKNYNEKWACSIKALDSQVDIEDLYWSLKCYQHYEFANRLTVMVLCKPDVLVVKIWLNI